jgi:hypothetical protein
MSTFTERMKGAAFLNVDTYTEVEHDTQGTSQAATVVVLGALAAAIGAARWGIAGMVAGAVFSLLGWVIAAGITNFIGVTLLGGTATWSEMLRTLGFAQSPKILLVLGIIPGLGAPVGFVVWVWLLFTQFVAIREALDVSNERAFVTALLANLAFIPLAALGVR